VPGRCEGWRGSRSQRDARPRLRTESLPVTCGFDPRTSSARQLNEAAETGSWRGCGGRPAEERAHHRDAVDVGEVGSAKHVALKVAATANEDLTGGGAAGAPHVHRRATTRRADIFRRQCDASELVRTREEGWFGGLGAWRERLTSRRADDRGRAPRLLANLRSDRATAPLARSRPIYGWLIL